MSATSTTPVPVPCSATPGLLSEGPRWDAERGELLWVDIVGSRLHRARLDADGLLEVVASIQFDRMVGAVAPAVGGGYVLAAGTGFLFADASGEVRELAQPEAGRADVRMNDGACDPQGRFWAGTMAHDESPGAGVLYRLELDGSCTTVLGGTDDLQRDRLEPRRFRHVPVGQRHRAASIGSTSMRPPVEIGGRRTIVRDRRARRRAGWAHRRRARGHLGRAVGRRGGAVLQPGWVAARNRSGSGRPADVVRVRRPRSSDAVHHDRPARARRGSAGATAGCGARVPGRRPRGPGRAVRTYRGSTAAGRESL